MPTYYNGKEIKATSKLSGIDLTGKSSIKFGGKSISLVSAPPRPIAYTFVNTGSRVDRDACIIGPGLSETSFLLYGDSDSRIGVGTVLYIDEELTNVYSDMSAYHYCFDTNDSVVFDSRRTGIIEVLAC